MATVIYTIAPELERAAGAIKQVLEAGPNHYGTLECVVLRPKARTFQLKISDYTTVLLGATEKEAKHTLAALLYGIQLGIGKI